MKQMFKNAKVGDRVWSIMYGRGTIERIENPEETHYPINVRFDDEEVGTVSYTYEGLMYNYGKRPDLYWGELSIGPAPVKKVPVEFVEYCNVYRGNSFLHLTPISISTFSRGSMLHSKEACEKVRQQGCSEGFVGVAEVTYRFEAEEE